MRVPKSVAAASALIERFAAVDAALAGIEAVRNAAIVAANQVADDAGVKLLKEREELVTALATWWPGAAQALTEGKRKSAELAGCYIGSKAGRASLGVDGKEADVVTAMAKQRWTRLLLRVTASLDRVAILKALDGKRGEELGALGFKRNEGSETFFIERVAQDGTLAGTKA